MLKRKPFERRQLMFLHGMRPHSSTNDAHQVEELFQLHVVSKNLQSIRAEERYSDFISEIDVCEFFA